MKLRQLEVLVAVKECGTITGAAEKLLISQPSLSVALKELEDELGILLFQRSNSGVALTSVGEDVYQYSRDILKKVAAIQTVALDEYLHEDRFIAVASNFRSGNNLLGKTILAMLEECQFCRQYHFSNAMENQTQTMLIENLLNKKLDLTIIKIDYFEEETFLQILKKAKLLFHELYTEQLYLVARQGHPLSGKNFNILDLQKYHFVFEENDLNAYISSIYGVNYCISDGLVIENTAGLRRYLASTDAVAVMSKAELEQSKQIYEIELEILELEDFEWHRKVGVLRRDEKLRQIEDAFIEKVYHCVL